MIVEGDPDAHGRFYDTRDHRRRIRPLTKLEHIPPEPAFWVVGVDLANSVDRTAITVVEVHRGWAVTVEIAMWQNPNEKFEKHREEDLHYVVRNMIRPRQGVGYPEIIRQVQSVIQELPKLPDRTVLAVDETGLGAPVVASMRQSGLRPLGITITGGNAATLTGSRSWSVPKSLLVSELRLAMHQKRLKIAQGFAEREQLANEMAAFTARLTASGRATFEAAGDEFDDSVMSLSYSILAAKNRPKPIRIQKNIGF